MLDLAASVEPNLKASALGSVTITLSDRDIRNIRLRRFIYDQKLAKNHIKNVKKVNTLLLKKAVSELSSAVTGTTCPG